MNPEDYIRTYRGQIYRIVSSFSGRQIEYRIQEPLKLFGRILWWEDLSVMDWGGEYIRSSASISFRLTGRTIKYLEDKYHRLINGDITDNNRRKSRKAYGFKIHAKGETDAD